MLICLIIIIPIIFVGYHVYKYAKAYKDDLEDLFKNIQLQNEQLKQEVLEIKDKLDDLQKELAEYYFVKKTEDTPSIDNGYVKNSQTNVKTIEEQKDPYVSDTLKTIRNVKKDVTELGDRIKYYKGSPGDRMYKQFNEKVIRYLIKLDTLDAKDYKVISNEKRKLLSM